VDKALVAKEKEGRKEEVKEVSMLILLDSLLQEIEDGTS